MYFLRFKRLPLVLGGLIGLLLPFPKDFAFAAHLWALICVSLMMVEQGAILCLSIRFGGWKEGVAVAGWAIMVAGLTLPEFNRMAQDVRAQACAEWEHQRKLGTDQAAAKQAAVRAALEERARRYARRLTRLLGGDVQAAGQVTQQLVQMDPAAAEEQLSRASRLKVFLGLATPLGDQHATHITAIFKRAKTLAEAELESTAYLGRVRREGLMLVEARTLGVHQEVLQALSRQDAAAAEEVLIRARALAARHLELQTLKAAVDRAPAHHQGHLRDLLAKVRASLANPREFRKASHALRQRLPQNGRS